MALVTKTCLAISEQDSSNVNEVNTGSCDCGKYTSSQVNNCCFNFDSINTLIPVGSVVSSAIFTVAKVSGGYSLAETIVICMVSGGYWAFTWADFTNAIKEKIGPTTSVSVSGTGSATLTFDITSLIQWIVNNASDTHIFKFERNPNLASSGSQDAKRFSTTAGNHKIDITYTAPTAPTAPSNLTMSPDRFNGVLNCNWQAGGAGTNNPVTDYYIKLYKNGTKVTEGTVGNVLTHQFDVSSWAEGDVASFDIYTIGTYAPLNSGTVTSGSLAKNTKPNTPTSPLTTSTADSNLKTTFIPGDTIRVRFTAPNPRDPDTGHTNGDIAGYEVKMQDAAGNDYNSGQIVGTNASGTATYVDVNTAGFTQGSQWKFLVRGYDSYGVKGTWSAATALVTMNTAPLAPSINYPAAGSTVYNRKPRILATAANTNDGPKHIFNFKLNSGGYFTTAANGTYFSTGVNDNLAANRKLVIQEPGTQWGLGSQTITAKMNDSFLDSPEITRQFTIAAIAFTDPVLTPDVTYIWAYHITEIQTAVGILRTAYGLSAISWKPVVSGVTSIADDTIISQIQNALQDIITLINSWDAANATFDISVEWQSVLSTVGEDTGVDPHKLRLAIEQLRTLITSI